MKKKDPRVTELVQKAPAFARPILRAVRDLVHAADPEITEDVKWGAPAFVRDGIVCSVGAFKNHVGVWFHKGALMKDPKNLLQPGARARTMKVLELTSADELDGRAFKALVTEAVRLNQAGVVAKPAARRVVVPAPLRKALQQDPKAKAFFESLPPSHRREYAEHIAEAKRPETVERRLAKTLAALRKGQRPHEKYRRKA